MQVKTPNDIYRHLLTAGNTIRPYGRAQQGLLLRIGRGEKPLRAPRNVAGARLNIAPW